MHTTEAAAAGETAVRLNLVAAWRESSVFSDAERAALALTEAGTRALRRGPDDGSGGAGGPDQRGQTGSG